MNTLQVDKFVEGIEAGAYIDVRDCEGDWFEARIVSVNRSQLNQKIAKCHFINYSSKWDCNIVLSTDNIARRNAHSTSTGKCDEYKYLLECVHELLFLRNDRNYVCAAKEMDIALDEFTQFINTGEPKNESQKMRIIHWVRTQSKLMKLSLKILEMDEDGDTRIGDGGDGNATRNVHMSTLNALQGYTMSNLHTLNSMRSLQMSQMQQLNRNIAADTVKKSINSHGIPAIPAPPADILASCIASFPKIMLNQNVTRNPAAKTSTIHYGRGGYAKHPTDVGGSTISSLSSASASSNSSSASSFSSPANIKLAERAHYAGSKRARTNGEDALPTPKKRKLLDNDVDDEESEYSTSSYNSDDFSDSDHSISDSDQHSNESDSVMVPQTNGTKITFIKMSQKQFEREQKEFEKEAQIAKQELLKKEEQEKLQTKKQQLQNTNTTNNSPSPRKQRSTSQMDEDADIMNDSTSKAFDPDDNDFEDLCQFEYELSDANLNLRHSIYPNRKFRGIAKSGRRWRARTCINGKTRYGDRSFYNPFLAAMEYDRMGRANRKPELSGAIKTKTQIILNFPYGLKRHIVRIHKLFEKELQQMDQEEIKKTFGAKYRNTDLILDSGDEEEIGKKKSNQNVKKKNKKKNKNQSKALKEEPIIDNKGLNTKIPKVILERTNALFFASDKLKPFGPCYVVDDTVPVINHYVKNRSKKNKEAKKSMPKKIEAEKEESGVRNVDEWKVECCATSLFFGYRTLHMFSDK